MNYLNLEEIKAQCRIDTEFVEDDALLEGMGDAAESFLAQHLNKQLDDIAAENSGELPKALHHALLMLIDYLYDQSGSGKMEDVPSAFFVLCLPFKHYSVY